MPKKDRRKGRLKRRTLLKCPKCKIRLSREVFRMCEDCGHTNHIDARKPCPKCKGKVNKHVYYKCDSCGLVY